MRVVSVIIVFLLGLVITICSVVFAFVVYLPKISDEAMPILGWIALIVIIAVAIASAVVMYVKMCNKVSPLAYMSRPYQYDLSEIPKLEEAVEDRALVGKRALVENPVLIAVLDHACGVPASRRKEAMQKVESRTFGTWSGGCHWEWEEEAGNASGKWYLVEHVLDAEADPGRDPGTDSNRTD